MKNKIFDEFYFLETQRNHNFDEIDVYVNNHNDDYSLYKGKIRCPECKLAELTFIHKTSNKRSYLKKIPSSSHTDSCSYNYEYVNNKTIKTYFENLDENQVQDKLTTMLRFLMKEQDCVSNNINVQIAINSNPMLFSQKNRNSSIRKTLRRKKLTEYIDQDLVGDDLYMIYGNVKLSVDEKTGIDKNNREYKYYFLKVKILNKNDEWKIIASIYRGGFKDNIDRNSIYQFAVIGYFKFNTKSDKKYLNIELLNNQAIKYKRDS